MTTRPRLYDGATAATGLAAVALFGVFAAVFLTADFGTPAGFPADASITASIGYAMFDIPVSAVDAPLVTSEPFLVAFEIIDVVLVAALVGSVTLARREGASAGAVVADGGRRLVDHVRNDGGED
ncbi:MAG: proton-conducting membrane transporter [Halolamina sp.]